MKLVTESSKEMEKLNGSLNYTFKFHELSRLLLGFQGGTNLAPMGGGNYYEPRSHQTP